MGIVNLNSLLFQLILKSNSNILTKKLLYKKFCNIALSKYCNIALSLYRNIACENRPSDEGLKESILYILDSYLAPGPSLRNWLRKFQTKAKLSLLISLHSASVGFDLLLGWLRSRIAWTSTSPLFTRKGRRPTRSRAWSSSEMSRTGSPFWYKIFNLFWDLTSNYNEQKERTDYSKEAHLRHRILLF